MNEEKEIEVDPQNPDSQKEALEKQLAEERAKREKLESENSQLTKDKTSLVGELKELRSKKEEPKETQKEEPKNPEDIDSKIEEHLNKRDKERFNKSKDDAFNRFISENKAFNPENDESGLKQEALKKKLSLFNTDGATSIEEYNSMLSAAANLLLGNDAPKGKGQNVVTQDPPVGDNPPAETPEIALTDKEKAVARRMGWDEERFLKRKKADPSFVERLMSREF